MMQESACHIEGRVDSVGVSGAELIGLLKSFLRDGGSCRMTVHGSSMTPLIRHGDVVLLSSNVSELIPGDVVAASDKDGGRILVHRIVDMRDVGEDAELLLRGDSGCDEAEWLHRGGVLGVVRGVERGSRRIIFFRGLVGRIAAWFSCKISRLRRNHTGIALLWIFC